MKRRVRIYKAQMGGVAAMQNAQEQQAQIGDEQIANAAIEMMQNGIDSNQILQTLVSKGVEQEKAVQILSAIENRIAEERELGLAKEEQDQDTVDDLEAQQMAEEQAAQEELAQRQRLQELYGYNTADYEDGAAEEDYGFVENNLMRNGGASSKRKFMRNAMKTLKAQEGTEMQQNIADSTDTGERAQQLNNFLGSVKSTGDQALMKKDAEALYNTVSQYPYSDPNTPQAQYGANMSPRQQRRFNRRLNRFIGSIPIPMNGLMPSGFVTQPFLNNLQSFIPSTGSYSGGPRLANIDVRRTGLFGKPKEYTITFAQEAFQNPQLKRDVFRLEQYNEEQKIKDAEEEKKDVEEKVAKEESKSSTKESSNRPAVESNPYANVPPIVIPPVIPPVITPPVTSGARSIYSNANTPEDMYYYNPDKPGFTYAYNQGKLFYDENPEDALKFIEITDPTRIKQLNEKLRSGDLYTLPSKAGYYYRMRPDGAFAKFKGDPKKHTSSAQQLSVIKPGDTNYDYLKKNAKFFGAYSGQKQTGGFVDPNSDLTKFVYGGVDDIALPEIQGKLTDSPYFEEGGYLPKAQTGKIVKAYKNGKFVGYMTQEEADKQGLDWNTANDYDSNEDYNTNPQVVYPGGDTYFKQKGMPYFTGTGDPYAGYITPWTDLKSIEVKNRLFGAPKLTYNFGNYDPTAPLIGPKSSTTTQSTQTPVTENSEKQKGDLYYKTRQLFQNLSSSKEGDQSPRLRNWIDQKRSEKMGVPFPEIKAYGGDMDYAQTGLNYPYAQDPRFAPVYTDNPDFVGMSDIDLLSGNITGNLSGFNNQSIATDYNPGAVNTVDAAGNIIDFEAATPDITQTAAYQQAEKDPAMNLKIDPNQPNRQTQKKNLVGDFSIKGKAKTPKTNAEYMRELLAFNALTNQGLNLLGERGDAQREAQLRNRYLADNLYGSTGQYDRGTYEINSGLFRPDQMGFTGVVRDGGSIYEEGGETYMSEDQIRRFLEEGGELEFV